jgi:hypothetical protein
MAEVVVQQGAQGQAQSSSGVSGDVQGLFSWIGHYWWLILLFIIFVVVVVIIIYLIIMWAKAQKRKDIMYLQYERAVEACKINGRKDYVVKIRRWKLILWGLVTAPLFTLVYLVLLAGEHWLMAICIFVGGFLMWLPFAWFFYKEHSMRVVNCDKVTQGYYRGHARKMDGYIYFAMKIGRKWLILDDIIIFRVPENVRSIRLNTVYDKGTKEKKTVKEWDFIELKDIIVENENGWYIFIPFTTVYKDSTYFYDLTLLDKHGSTLDLRQKIAGSYHLLTQIEMAEREYSHLGQVTDQAVNTNVGVTANKKLPEHERDVKSNNDAQGS